MCKGEESTDAPYLQFLTPLPHVLADQERRAREARPPFSLEATLAEKDQSKRIAALVQALDEVSARQWGQPGGVDLAQDAIVSALIKEGEPAVEPLIDDMESDTRLTRSVSFGRDFFMDRRPIAANNAAYIAICGILRTNEFGGNSYQDGPKATAARIRAYWQQNKGITQQERWYRTLMNDDASADQWLEAAQLIVQRSNITTGPEPGWSSERPLKPGETAPMRGEPLRGKTNPSVAELMAKRAVQITGIKVGNSMDTYTMEKACQLGLYLAEWDNAAAVPALGTLFQRCKASQDYQGMLARKLAQITMARRAGKDPQAAGDYAAWIRTVQPRQVGDNGPQAMEPLWREPDDPTLAAAAQWLFNDPASPWSSLLVNGIVPERPDTFFGSTLLGIPAFRRHLLTALGDPRIIGTIARGTDARYLDLRWANNNGGFGVPIPGDLHAGDFATPQPLRRCDAYAIELSNIEGMPEFAFYPSLAKRDSALRAMVDFLQYYGAQFAYNPALTVEFPYDTPGMSPPAQLSFPRLDHPATTTEVEQGKAIFALPAGAESRLVSLPSFPLPAIWITLKKYPTEQSTYDPVTRKEVMVAGYDQNVKIWQAEEQRVGGVWQRWYGIVGKHEVARVPAAEIEFMFDPGHLTNGVDCNLSLPNGSNYSAGAPKTLIATLRNRLGVAQRVPVTLFHPGADGKPALRQGVELLLCYTPSLPGVNRDVYQAFEPVATTHTATFVPDKTRKLLEATESVPAGQFDPTDWLDLSKTGIYTLHLHFSKASDIGEGDSNYLTFTVGASKSLGAGGAQ